ncbi:MAG: DNA topoisomerase (ATP-hydrolyzing) subunit A, partial [Clostridiales bacterium]|nr:DNA topoisomerase (ATP-hydrolyzing) subunit A [Clostridiales bacterium]
FDATEKEPSVLPVRIPNILVNGAEGIAVGMATSIPPHNLGEVIDGVIACMKDPDITTEEMMEIIPGPDFPTGGIVINKDELTAIYESGNGKIKLRGKVQIEKVKGGKENIVITEIPYTMIGSNIGKFLNDVYSLVETKKTTDIVDISNQSSKEGIRIVIELKKGADAENICNLLYKKTRLEDTFGVNMLAVANGRPETMGIVSIIKHNVRFQYELATRKYTTLLNKEKEKQEIQEGLIKACDVIDLIIEILRGSKNIKQAKACLVEGDTSGIKFKSQLSRKTASMLHFTERQASAILEMRLYKLIGLEIEALIKEHDETLRNIESYEKILKSRAAMVKVLIKELLKFKKEFATPRKTLIENGKEAVYEEKAPEAIQTMLLMDRFGYVKSVDMATFERNKEAAEQESREIIPVMSDDRVLLFTDTGQMHTVKMADVPFGKFRDKGIPVDNICNYDSSSENIVGLAACGDMAGRKLLFVTKAAMVKRVDASEFDVAKRTIAATKLSGGDALLCVGLAEDDDTFVMASGKSYFLRVTVGDIPAKKKGAIGVRGMRLAAGDSLTNAWILSSETSPAVTINGKEVILNRLHIGSRDTKGVKR